jgi:hypothetical protein
MPVVAVVSGRSPEGAVRTAAAFRNGLSKTGAMAGQNWSNTTGPGDVRPKPFRQCIEQALIEDLEQALSGRLWAAIGLRAIF